jgi:hypothetical protein
MTRRAPAALAALAFAGALAAAPALHAFEAG